MAAITVAEALKRAFRQFSEAGVENPRQEAEILLARVTGWERLTVLLGRDRQLSVEQATAFRAAVKRRSLGEPLAYITGSQEFFGLTFKVDRRVLIPRPETEFIVEAALAWARQHHPAGEGVHAVDLGTGSGNLAVTLARLLPGARFQAVDISIGALQVARQNAAAHGVAERISWRLGSYCKPFADLDPLPRFNLIVANPPYIAGHEMPALPLPVKAYEPHLALCGGAEGMDSYRCLLGGLGKHLEPPGLLVMEIGAGQAAAVRELCLGTGLFKTLAFRKDYQGWLRVLEAVF